MIKTFHLWASDYRLMLPEFLYGEARKISEEIFAESEFNLYMVCKLPKMRLVPEKCRIGLDFNVLGVLRFDNGKKINFNASLAQHWFHNAEVAKNFSSTENLTDYLNFWELRSEFTKGRVSESLLRLISKLLPPQLKYKAAASIDYKNSNGRQLEIICPLSFVLSNTEINRVSLYPHRILNINKNDLKIYPQVIYIGKTGKNNFSRLQHHEKLQKILAEKEDNEDLILCLLQVSSERYDNSVYPDSGITVMVRGANSEVCKDDITDIAETTLINYFKPLYNELKRETPIPQNKKVVEGLIRNQYTDLDFFLETRGAIAKFWSDSVPASNVHKINVGLID